MAGTVYYEDTDAGGVVYLRKLPEILGAGRVPSGCAHLGFGRMR